MTTTTTTRMTTMTTTTTRAGAMTTTEATTETTARPVPVRDTPDVPRPTALGEKIERLRWVPSSLRARIVAWFIGVLALSTVGLVVVTSEVLEMRLDQRIDADLRQEAAELGALATRSIDPTTGKPFSNVRRIFDVYLVRNVPSRHEAFITFLAGEPYLRSRQVVPYRLDTDPELVARWASLTATDRGGVSTPAGRVEYLAIPLKAGGETGGVFVAAIFRDRSMSEAENSAIFAAGAVGLGVLLLGSLLAWRLADRVVQPVTALTRTARSISETDLSGRIPSAGRDEVAQLATTFNEMLDRLELAFASQRRFADDASHELKTPLTIVRGHLELLDDDPVERRETLALVTDELDRMGRIVEDLLLLARREEPDFLSFSTVDVGALTDQLFAKAKALSPRDWILDVRGQGVIVADRQRLVQAVVQLAENAARYSDPRDPIAIGSIVSGGEARLWIRDRGPGIPEHEQKAIFERFRRGAGNGRTEGAGLGLAIVKTIAEAHRGRVELETSSTGSVFSIVVPVDQPPDL
jgi:signal transduction histidine kinase